MTIFCSRLLLTAASLIGITAHGLAQSYTLNTLYKFNENGFGLPDGGLAVVGGNLYGETNAGDDLFRYTISSGAMSAAVSLRTGGNGVLATGLTSDGNGILYATTETGGKPGVGSLLRYDTSANSLTTLIDFTTAAGEHPNDGVTIGASGILYGTTSAGGTSQVGTLYQYDPNGGGYSTLLNFTGSNGASPFAGLLPASGGIMYGTTSVGGASGDGTLYKYDITSGLLSTLYSFSGTNGSYSSASLLSDGLGNLYGTTARGGIGYGNNSPESGDGTLFRYNIATGILTTLLQFNGTNGSNVGGTLLSDGSGGLIGFTLDGGTADDGTVFRYDINGGTLKTLVNFTGMNGQEPNALISDGAGGFYGITYLGGNASSGGTLFDLTPTAPEPAAALLTLFGAAAALVPRCLTSRRDRRNISVIATRRDFV